MGAEFTEAQNNLLKRIATENGFTDYTIEVYSTQSKGDNYIAEIKCVTIKVGDRKLEVVVKKAPSNDDFRKFFPIEDIFHVEIHVYDIIFDTFKHFQKENNVKEPFDNYAKIFGKCEEKYSECLVLENLIKNGYRHWNRKLPMNAEHIKLVMKTYGKFHAISFAMKKKNPLMVYKLLDDLKQSEEFEKDNFTAFLRNVIPLVEKAASGHEVLENAAQRITKDLDKYFYQLSLESDDTKVITHGDCWNNNMLFKYEDPTDSEKPTRVCLIDWQMAKFGSPMLDISYFFCASSVKEILYDYKIYLKIYYDSLSEQLRNMSSDPEELFPFEKVEVSWKKYAIFGVMVGSFVFRMLYVESKNAPVVNKGTATMDGFYEQFNNMGNDEKVHGRIRDLLTFMVENDFI